MVRSPATEMGGPYRGRIARLGRRNSHDHHPTSLGQRGTRYEASLLVRCPGGPADHRDPRSPITKDKASYRRRFALKQVGGLVTSDAVYKSFYTDIVNRAMSVYAYLEQLAARSGRGT